MIRGTYEAIENNFYGQERNKSVGKVVYNSSGIGFPTATNTVPQENHFMEIINDLITRLKDKHTGLQTPDIQARDIMLL